MEKTNKGFTLVELIIVIAVIAILATVLAPQYIQYVERSRQSNDLQMAINLMDATTVAIADPQNDIPSNYTIYVSWRTTADPNNTIPELLGTTPLVFVANTGSVWIEPNNTVDGSPLDNLRKSIAVLLGQDAVTGNLGNYRIPPAQSAAGNGTDFAFRIVVSTGTIEFLKNKGSSGNDWDNWSIYEADNPWITEIGVSK